MSVADFFHLAVNTGHAGCAARSPNRLAIAVLSCALLATPFAASAQTAGAQQSSDWRSANDAAGRFLRGHVDILRAEQASSRTRPPQNVTSASANAKGEKDDTNTRLTPLSLSDAKRIALTSRPDLFATGALSAIEDSQRAAAVAELMLQVELAWIQAVAQSALAVKQAQRTEAAQIASELAQRMGAIGNFAQDRVIAAQLQASTQQSNLIRARQDAAKAKGALAQLLLLEELRLADALPEIRGIGARQDLAADPVTIAMERLQRLPGYASLKRELQVNEQAVGAKTLEQWDAFAQASVSAALGSLETHRSLPPAALVVDRSKVLWSHELEKVLEDRRKLAAMKLDSVTTVRLAQSTVRSNHAQAMLMANEVLPLAQQAEEEAVYQYNGMFISTWQLLDYAGQRIDAEMALLGAQMAYWQAEFAYRAFLAGAAYVNVGDAGAVGGGAAAGSPAGGH